MTNMTHALVFVIILNALMMLSQAAMLDINPDGSVVYTGEGSIIESFDSNPSGDPVLDTDTIQDRLPSGEASVSPTTGNVFTDIFSSIKGWIGDHTGLTYVFNIVSAPYSILKLTHLPTEFVYIVGSLWYGITFFLLIAFFWGRDA